MAEQKTDEGKSAVVAPLSAALVQLKINGVVTQQKISLPALEKKALELEKNEDNLKVMADLLQELVTVEDLAEEVHQKGKKPYLDGGRAWDAGKKLVLEHTKRIRGMFEGDYTRLLDGVATRKRLAAEKEIKDHDILKGIEENVISFSNLIVAATTRKALTEVESRINLEKSSSRATKYGDFHAQAIARYDSVLIPIIKDQKAKVDKLEALNAELLQAEANNDPDKMDELLKKVDIVSNEILQNHAVIQEAALNQESFPIIDAPEVLPAFKVKRTNYSIEIADEAIALRKAPELLEITINKEAAKVVLEKLKTDGSFHDKDEVVLNGIKYTAIRIREAL